MESVLSTPIGSCRILEAAYDVSRQHLATISEDDTVSIYWRPYREDDWSLLTQWRPENQTQLSKLAWTHPALGVFLAIASENPGDISIWEIKARSWEPPETALGIVGHLFTIKVGSPVTAVEFAPKDYGLHLAAATASSLRMFSPAVADPAVWVLENELDTLEPEEVTSVSWKPQIQDVPPMLLVGTASGAKVWVHEPSLMRWLVSVELPLSQRVASVAWSNPLGRPLELIAIATGTNVTLFSLNGPADKLQVKEEARLSHPSAVLQIKWNLFGNWLAASTQSSEVLMWRANLLGQWRIVNRLVGVPLSEMQ